MGGVGKNFPVRVGIAKECLRETPVAPESFMRASMRPDWILSGNFTEEERAGFADQVRALLRRGFLTPNEGRALILSEPATVTVLPQPACRYCRSLRDRSRTSCRHCGAPYPALTL